MTVLLSGSCIRLIGNSTSLVVQNQLPPKMNGSGNTNSLYLMIFEGKIVKQSGHQRFWFVFIYLLVTDYIFIPFC